MGVGVIGIDTQRGFVVLARLRVLARAIQQICQVHMSDRMIGMVMDGFRINAAGGVDSAHVRQQVSEPVECVEVRRRPSQDRDEGLLCFLPSVEGAEQHRALDFTLDGAGTGGVARDKVIELSQSRLLRLPGSPAAITVVNAACDSRALFRFGHDVRGPDLNGFRLRQYLPIRLQYELQPFRPCPNVAKYFQVESRNTWKQNFQLARF
jgi:hypothetical protein